MIAIFGTLYLYFPKYLCRNPVASNVPKQIHWKKISMTLGQNCMISIILRPGNICLGSLCQAIICPGNICQWRPSRQQVLYLSSCQCPTYQKPAIITLQLKERKEIRCRLKIVDWLHIFRSCELPPYMAFSDRLARLDNIKSPDWSKVGMLYHRGGLWGRWVRQGGHMLQQKNKTNKGRLNLAMPHLDISFC